MKKRQLLMVLSSVMLIGGCVSSSEYQSGKAEIVNSVTSAEGKILQGQIHLLNKDRDGLLKNAEEARKEMAAINARAAKQAEEAAKTEADLWNLGKTVLTATDLAAGGKIDPIVQGITKKIDERVDETTKRISAISDSMSKTDAELKALIEKNKELAKEVEDAQDVNAELKAKYDSLSESTKEKFAAASKNPELIAELERLKGNDEQFREKLKSDLKLTEQEMEQLKGFTPAEIMALLTVGGIGLGGGRLGKSRSQGELDKINARLDAQEKTQPAGAGG